MASWQPDDGMGPSQKVLEIIINYLTKVSRPTYLGILSLEIHWSLARTQQAVDKLVDRGLVRELTLDDKKRRGFPSIAALYELVDEKSRR